MIFFYFRAIKRFSAAVRVDPTYVRGYICRAEAYEKVGNVSDLASSDLNLVNCYLTSNILTFCSVSTLPPPPSISLFPATTGSS